MVSIAKMSSFAVSEMDTFVMFVKFPAEHTNMNEYPKSKHLKFKNPFAGFLKQKYGHIRLPGNANCSIQMVFESHQ